MRGFQLRLTVFSGSISCDKDKLTTYFLLPNIVITIPMGSPYLDIVRAESAIAAAAGVAYHAAKLL